MDILQTLRLIIRPCVTDDLAQAHQLLDVDIQWAGPSSSLERRREQHQFQIALANWDLTGRIYGYRAILLRPHNRGTKYLDSGMMIGCLQWRL